MAKLRRKRKYAVTLAVLLLLWAILPPQLALGSGMLTNSNFNSNVTTGWSGTTSGTITLTHDSAGYTEWLDNAGSRFQGQGGSARFFISGRNVSGVGRMNQGFSVSTTTPRVHLSFAWKKFYQRVPARQDLKILLVRPDATTIELWSDSTFDNSNVWETVTDLDISSQFNGTGTYTLRLEADFRTVDSLGTPREVYAWFDEVYLQINSSLSSPGNQQAKDAGTGGAVSLTWNSVPGAQGYNVYRTSNSAGTYQKVNGSMVAGTSYTDSGLTNGTTYYYKVVAVDSLGYESLKGDYRSAVPTSWKTSAVPSGLVVTDPETGDSLELSWSAVTEPGLSGYNIYRATSAEGIYTKVNAILVTATTYISTGLTGGVSYYYKVASVRGSDGLESNRSAYQSGVPATAAPAGLRVTNTGTGGTLHISWYPSGAGDLAGYNIYRAELMNGPYEKLNAAPLVATEYTDEGLVNGMTYHYKVTMEALDNSESEAAGPVSATPSLASSPPTPTGLRVESTGTGFSLAVRWNEVNSSDLAGYNLYRAESAGGPYSKVNTDEVLLANNHLDSGLTEGQPYYYKVAAVNIFEMESEWSAAVSAVPDYFEFAEHSGFSFSAITGGDGFVHLEWDNIRGAAQYRVLRSTNGVDWLEVYNGGLFEFTDSGLTNYVNYYYKLEASDGEGTVTSAVARAFPPNTSPHGFFNQQTTLCASCHVAHSASGPKLMLAATQVALCTTCHDGTASKYDVLNGTVVVPGGGVKPSPAGPFGWLALGVGDVDVPAGYSYTAGAANVLEEPTSIHRLGTRNDQAPGSNISNSFTAMDQLSCGHCHDVHGSDNYRILRKNMRTTISQWAPAVSVMAYAETTAEGEDVTYLYGSVFFCGSCHSDFNQWSGSGKRRVRSTKQEGYILSNESEDLFMHAVNVTNSYKGLPPDESLPYENGHVICLTCHFAHGTRAQGPSPLRSGTWSTALKRFDEMEGCENCHDKTNFPYHP